MNANVTPGSPPAVRHNSANIAPKERDAAIQALRSGVVPRLGIRHIQVGRADEVKEVIKDVTRIADGGCAVRFIVGDFGAGKTFFLNLARAVASERKLVVMSADLSPDRRIHASSGQGQARLLCADLIRSMATRTRPDGGALGSILDRYIGEAREIASQSGKELASYIKGQLEPIKDLACGYDFANVIIRYAEASENDDPDIKEAALRWLRAEYGLKSEAKDRLGVRTIVDDGNFLEHLKAVACLIRLAGYDGTFIVLDELVNLYKIVNPQARNSNYEQILRIVNDALQGSAVNLGFYFGATPDCMTDSRRGLFSYEALRSRLAENSFARQGLVDLSGPVIRLPSLTPEDVYVLLVRLRRLWAGGDETKLLVPDEALQAFLGHISAKVGTAYFQTPRNTIKAFCDLLAIIEQNPGVAWRDLINSVAVAIEAPAGSSETHDEPDAGIATGSPPSGAAIAAPGTPDDDLTTFHL